MLKKKRKKKGGSSGQQRNQSRLVISTQQLTSQSLVPPAWASPYFLFFIFLTSIGTPEEKTYRDKGQLTRDKLEKAKVLLDCATVAPTYANSRDTNQTQGTPVPTPESVKTPSEKATETN